MEIVSETHTTLKHHRILVVQAAEQVVSVQELVLERLFALAQILQQLAEILVSMIELIRCHLFRVRHLRLQLLGLPQRGFIFLLPFVAEGHLFELLLAECDVLLVVLWSDRVDRLWLFWYRPSQTHLFC